METAWAFALLSEGSSRARFRLDTDPEEFPGGGWSNCVGRDGVGEVGIRASNIVSLLQIAARPGELKLAAAELGGNCRT